MSDRKKKPDRMVEGFHQPEDKMAILFADTQRISI